MAVTCIIHRLVFKGRILHYYVESSHLSKHKKYALIHFFLYVKQKTNIVLISGKAGVEKYIEHTSLNKLKLFCPGGLHALVNDLLVSAFPRGTMFLIVFSRCIHSGVCWPPFIAAPGQNHASYTILIKGFFFFFVISNAISVQERFHSFRETECHRDGEARFNEIQLEIWMIFIHPFNFKAKQSSRTSIKVGR